jgi:hypothetical protein
MITKQATVEELKDVLNLAIGLIESSFLIYNDGQLSLSDFTHVWGIVEKIGPAIVGIGSVPGELKDLDAAECDELIKFIMDELADVTDVKAKNILEATLKAFKACYEVYIAVEASVHANS